MTKDDTTNQQDIARALDGSNKELAAQLNKVWDKLAFSGRSSLTRADQELRHLGSYQKVGSIVMKLMHWNPVNHHLYCERHSCPSGEKLIETYDSANCWLCLQEAKIAQVALAR